MTSARNRAVPAGFTYFLVVFAAGFVLGTGRVLLLSPWLGELTAVLIEVPVILILSWIACRWTVAHFEVPALVSARLSMGGIALALVLAADLALAVFAFGRPVLEHLAHFRETAGLVGLVGQFIFAIFPLLQNMAWRGGFT